MDANIKIDRFTVHYIDKEKKKYEPARQVLQDDETQLNKSVLEFLHKLISDVWDAEETGKINSAHFSKPPNDKVAKIVAGIGTKDYSGDFLDDSKELAKFLYDNTPGSASPGLFGVFRMVWSPTDKRKKEKVYVALLKIETKNEKFVKLKSAAITQMTVGAIKNLLLDKIQKGAIYPHPNKENYDLKVIDKQTPEEPAIYFSETFLGCEVKKSDDSQVHRLIPELETYARKKSLPFETEKVPVLITTLIRQNRDITTTNLADTIGALKLFGRNYNSADFAAYIIKESKLGALDIPAQYFSQRSGANPKPRTLNLKFNDPRYLGVELTGPLDLIRSLMTHQGGFVTFTINTNQNGFRIEWK